MQLKSLKKGRFGTYWKNHNDLIESIIERCILEKKIVDESSILL